MTTRMYIEKVAPGAAKAVFGLEQYVRSAVDNQLLELVKLRASYINECAYCVDSHSTEALKAGESTQRLFALAAWQDSPLFSDKERAALALTDAVTNIADDGVPESVWEQAKAQFSEEELANLLVAAATINVWNRLNIATRREPESAG